MARGHSNDSDDELNIRVEKDRNGIFWVTWRGLPHMPDGSEGFEELGMAEDYARELRAEAWVYMERERTRE